VADIGRDVAIGVVSRSLLVVLQMNRGEGMVGVIQAPVGVYLYSTHALTDLEDAVYYYNEQQIGLGKLFARQVQLSLKSIKKNPHFASFPNEEVRCEQVPKFPHLVHYTIDEDTRTVLIAAVYSNYQQLLGE
jgi:toxin ParE1/3/4